MTKELTTYHSGQEVEVQCITLKNDVVWRKAKIVDVRTTILGWPEMRLSTSIYEVQFPDGSREVYDEQHIRAVK